MWRVYFPSLEEKWWKKRELNKAKSTGGEVDTHISEDDVLKRDEFRWCQSADEEYEVRMVQGRLAMHAAPNLYMREGPE